LTDEYILDRLLNYLNSKKHTQSNVYKLYEFFGEMDFLQTERLKERKMKIFKAGKDEGQELKKPYMARKLDFPAMGQIENWKPALRTKPNCKATFKKDKHDKFWAINQDHSTELMNIWGHFGLDKIKRTIV
jgi:hypothetical protein